MIEDEIKQYLNEKKELDDTYKGYLDNIRSYWHVKLSTCKWDIGKELKDSLHDDNLQLPFERLKRGFTEKFLNAPNKKLLLKNEIEDFARAGETGNCSDNNLGDKKSIILGYKRFQSGYNFSLEDFCNRKIKTREDDSKKIHGGGEYHEQYYRWNDEKERFKWASLGYQFAAYVNYLETLQEQLTGKTLESSNKIQPPATTDQPKTETKATTKDEPETRTLKELFRNKNIYEDCLQLLRDTTVKAISDEDIFIGNNKGVLIVWYKCLEAKGVIPILPNRKAKTAILNNTFSEYNVSDGLFSQPNEKSTTDYENGFLRDIAAIKNQLNTN